MLPIALVGTLAFSAGLLSRIPYAHLALILLLTPWLFVSLIGATFAMHDSLRNAFRGGLRGFFYSQHWFEIARATLIAGVLMSITTIVLLYFGFSVIELTGIPIATAFGLFLAGSLMGYLLAGQRQHKPSGDAFDCVDFFLPQFLAGAAVVIPMVLFGKFIDPMYIVAYTVIVALALAVLLKLISWMRGASQNAG